MNTLPTDRVLVSINAAHDADAQEVEELTRSLYEELQPLLPVERVTKQELPKGAKALDAAIAGQLLLSLFNTGGVLVSAVGTIQAWMLRQNARSIVLEIDGKKLELKGATAREQRALVMAWINHVEARSADR